MASNESNHRVRANEFSTKHVFGQKKGRGQQLRDARANRTFSAAKQPDTTKMQPCIATADDELATPPRRKKGQHTNLVDLTECCGTLFVLWTLLLSSCFLVVPKVNKFS